MAMAHSESPGLTAYVVGRDPAGWAGAGGAAVAGVDAGGEVGVLVAMAVGLAEGVGVAEVGVALIGATEAPPITTLLLVEGAEGVSPAPVVVGAVVPCVAWAMRYGIT